MNQQHKIKIRNETSPQRCEICHQTDQFDASQNHCQRCALVKAKLMPLESSLPDSEFKRIERMIKLFLVTVTFAGSGLIIIVTSSSLLQEYPLYAIMLAIIAVSFFVPKLTTYLRHNFTNRKSKDSPA